jgi:hypothetical protein
MHTNGGKRTRPRKKKLLFQAMDATLKGCAAVGFRANSMTMSLMGWFSSFVPSHAHVNMCSNVMTMGRSAAYRPSWYSNRPP